MACKLFGKRFVILISLPFLLSSCFGGTDICYEGIEDFYAQGDRITAWLICHPSYDSRRDFINKYDHKTVYYRYIRRQKQNFHYRTAFLHIEYEPTAFKTVADDIHSQTGYSNNVLCEYNHYSFHLNLFYENYTNYNIEQSAEHPYIGDILLVGESDKLNSFVFLGFYYHIYAEKDYYGFYDPVSFYPFSGWDKFFEDNFSDVDWGID